MTVARVAAGAHTLETAEVGQDLAVEDAPVTTLPEGTFLCYICFKYGCHPLILDFYYFMNT